MKIYEKLREVYGEHCMSRENVYYWVREFQNFGRELVEDSRKVEDQQQYEPNRIFKLWLI